MKKLSLLILGLAVAGCVSAGPEEAATTVTVVTQRVYPGLSTEPVVSCVLANASGDEISSLGASAGNVGSAAQLLTLRIIDRPETDACLRARGITLGT